MNRITLNRTTLIVLIGAVLFFIFACFALLLLPRMTLMTSQRRWANRNFDAYRLQVEFTTISENCFYDIEITGQDISRINENWCDQLGWGYIQPLEPMTIDDILQKLAEEQYQLYCSPAGCRCGAPVINEVEWHPDLGYPEQWIRKEADLPIKILPDCPVIYSFRDFGRVLMLEPLN